MDTPSSTTPPEPAAPRSYVGIIADRLSSWLYGLASETHCFTIQTLRIPIPTVHFATTTNDTNNSKTIHLAAILYQPGTIPPHQPLGTVLVRSPYGLDYPLAVGHARIFAARGYQVLLCACRGTAGSEGGPFTPALDDVADGSAVALWMRRQEWYTGRWAMLGGSYLAWAQWATVQGLLLRKDGAHTVPAGDDVSGTAAEEEAAAALAELKAMITLVGPHDWDAYTFGTGVMNPDMVSWVGAMAALERRETWLPPPFHMSWHRERMARDLGGTPNTTGAAGPGDFDGVISLMDGMKRYIGGELPEWFEGILRGKIDFPVATDALGRLEGVAVLVVAGWADTFIEQNTQQYQELKARGQVVGLTVGPWGHLDAQGGESKREILQWLDQYLAPEKATKSQLDSRTSLVRVFDMGTKKWLEMPEWPPKTTTALQWFLGADGKLDTEAPNDNMTESSFEYDPRDPTPSIGSSMLNYQAGKLDDDRSLAERRDVLTFTTDPLEQDVQVMGSPSMVLWHTTSHSFADLSVRICAVAPDGASHNVSESYQRLDKSGRHDGSDQPLEVKLVDCAHTFRQGTRIRVVVAGGAHPKYTRNLGTGADILDGVGMSSAIHTVHHSRERVSKVMLPVAI